jgi:hypothetical protein
MSPSARPVVGEVYKRTLLSSEATYRVVGVEDDHVDVEAVAVPGLPEGFRMRLTAEAIATMQRVGAAAPAVAEGQGQGEGEARQARTTPERRLRTA